MTTPTPPSPTPQQPGWATHLALAVIGATLCYGVGWLIKQEFAPGVIAGIHTVHLAILFAAGVVALVVLLAGIPGALPQVTQGIASFGVAASAALKNAPLPWHRDGGGS